MNDDKWNEILVEQEGNYILELEDHIIVVEIVPARVSLESGERSFATETVKRLQKMVWESKKPTRVVENPYYEYASF